ncbi:L10-interacting MYB domain-containing protein-like [Lycium barbarum]|uniref:L10-interacting MYB domain-containing protein-like n=1 Tax=Lycium barbarum TaxID=112863 RepID=UPI00293ECEE1|nr:L10-interacting MYB domain-containing protein-like [Lycium barbarum]
MEQSSENSGVSWKDMDVVKTFLENCIQEVSLNGRLGSSLKPDSWNKVKLALETCHRFSVPQNKMKNYYDYLKEKYQAWFPLTKKTGNIYDPTTNTFQMSNSEWDEYIKAHPKAKTLRNSPLPFPDLCTKLFEGSTAIGIHDWSPSCTYPRPGVSSASTPIVIDTIGGAEDLFGDKNDEAPKDSPS